MKPLVSPGAGSACPLVVVVVGSDVPFVSSIRDVLVVLLDLGSNKPFSVKDGKLMLISDCASALQWESVRKSNS